MWYLPILRSQAELPTVTYLTGAATISADALVLGLTWVKTFRQWRSARHANIKDTIMERLLRDGEIIKREVLS